MKGRRSRLWRGRGRTLVLAVMVGVGGWMISLGLVQRQNMKAVSDGASRHPTGAPQLVSVQPLLLEAEGGARYW